MLTMKSMKVQCGREPIQSLMFAKGAALSGSKSNKGDSEAKVHSLLLIFETSE